VHKRRRPAAAVLAAGAIITALLAARWAGYRINRTASVPIGIWRLHPARSPLQRGEIVSLCPPPTPLFLDARARGYLENGECPGGLAPVLKPIAAIEGDFVELKAEGAYVNGAVMPNSQRLKTDRAGRILPQPVFQSFTVAEGEILLISQENARSFDSRYFGPLPLSGLLGVAEPVLTKQKKR
jgi:conjugative transfer signal peptidase TraF